MDIFRIQNTLTINSNTLLVLNKILSLFLSLSLISLRHSYNREVVEKEKTEMIGEWRRRSENGFSTNVSSRFAWRLFSSRSISAGAPCNWRGSPARLLINLFRARKRWEMAIGGGEDRRKREREIPGTGIKKTVLAAGQEISFSYSSLLPSRGPMPSDDRLIYSWSADLSFFRASWCPYESSIRRQFIFFEIFV